VNLDAVRTFVAVADAGQFQEAAADLSITQQAVSKRVAALERDLGARLFTRTPRSPCSATTSAPCRPATATPGPGHPHGRTTASPGKATTSPAVTARLRRRM
jgi:hypothetical protein